MASDQESAAEALEAHERLMDLDRREARSEQFHRALRSLGFLAVVVALPSAYPFFPILYPIGGYFLLGFWAASIVYFFRAAVLLFSNLQAYRSVLSFLAPFAILVVTLVAHLGFGALVYEAFGGRLEGMGVGGS